MELDLRKQKKNKTIEPIEEPTSKAVMEHIAEPTAENNDPLEITFD